MCTGQSLTTLPLLAPCVVGEAAEARGGGGGGLYRVGVSCINGASRSRTFMLQNEQQGELQGMGYTISLVERFGWSSASVVRDDTAAVASGKKLSTTPRAVTLNKILRSPWHTLEDPILF